MQGVQVTSSTAAVPPGTLEAVLGNVRWTETAEEEWRSSPVDLFQRSDFSDAFRAERQNTTEVKFPLLVESRI